MKILLGHASAKLSVKNSEFLAEVFPLQTQSEARSLLKSIKQKYSDASHVVHAFVLGASGGILGSSDDGEPSGTAGKPVLTVLKNSGLTNVLLTVTRWFGGTLLGTGGLVKAYTDSAKAVLAAAVTEEFIPKTAFTVFCSYPKYGQIKNRFTEFSAEIQCTEFKEEVKIEGLIPDAERAAFCAFLKNAAKGSGSVRSLMQAPETPL